MRFWCATTPPSGCLAGINTHACIRTAAIDAFQRDYDVILAGDCIAS
jgi:nicotinamidase-related amidase